MKRMMILLIAGTSILFAQKPDSSAIAAKDSVDIRAMVLEQINNAKQKQLTAQTMPDSSKPTGSASFTNVEKPSAPVVVRTVQTASVNSNFIHSFLELPLHYQIFSAITMTIIMFVGARRISNSLNRRTKNALKKKIGMLREEKVGGAKTNPKIQKTRKVLKNNLGLFKQNEKELSRNAKQLNIAKGELMLAARLKLLEVGKM